MVSVYHNHLEQNFPNPFNPTTTLAFSLKDGAKVNLTIYDVAGRPVRSSPMSVGSGGRTRSYGMGRTMQARQSRAGVFLQVDRWLVYGYEEDDHS